MGFGASKPKVPQTQPADAKPPSPPPESISEDYKSPIETESLEVMSNNPNPNQFMKPQQYQNLKKSQKNNSRPIYSQQMNSLNPQTPPYFQGINSDQSTPKREPITSEQVTDDPQWVGQFRDQDSRSNSDQAGSEEEALEVREIAVRNFTKMESQNVKDLYKVMTEADPGDRYFFLGIWLGGRR